MRAGAQRGLRLVLAAGACVLFVMALYACGSFCSAAPQMEAAGRPLLCDIWLPLPRPLLWDTTFLMPSFPASTQGQVGTAVVDSGS